MQIPYLPDIKGKRCSIKVLLFRDRAYFSLTCHSDDRGGDLSLLTSERLLELPNSEGILVSQIAGKTFSLDNHNTFI